MSYLVETLSISVCRSEVSDHVWMPFLLPFAFFLCVCVLVLLLQSHVAVSSSCRCCCLTFQLSDDDVVVP